MARNQRQRRKAAAEAAPPANQAVEDVLGNIGDAGLPGPTENPEALAPVADLEAAPPELDSTGAEVDAPAATSAVVTEEPKLADVLGGAEANPFADLTDTPPQEPAAPSKALADKVAAPTIPAHIPRPSRTTKRSASTTSARVPAAPQAVSPTAAKAVGKELAAKIPGAEHLKIRKRDSTNGAMIHIGDYSTRDIPPAMDVESFISAYVKPSFGGGLYEIKGVDLNGREFDAGTVRLAEKPQEPAAADNSMTALLQKMMDRDRETQDRLLAAVSNPQRGNQVNPVAQMREVHALKKELEGDVPKPNDSMSAVVQMMGQAQESNNQLLATILATQNKGPDPLTLALLQKLDEKPASAAAPMAPPVVNSGPDWMEIVQVVVTALPLVKEIFGNNDKLTTRDLLELTRPKDNLTTKDVIELLHSQPGTNDFKAAAENMTMMMNLQRMMAEASGGGGGGGVIESAFNAIGSALAQGNLSGRLQESMSDKEDQRARQEAQRIEQQRRATMAERRALAQERARLEAIKAGEPDPTEIPGDAVSVEDIPEGVPQDRVEAAERVQESQGSLPEFPPELPGHLNAWLEAISVSEAPEGNMVIDNVDDKLLAQRVVETFAFLFQVPSWKPIVAQLFMQVTEGDKAGSLEMIEAFFQGFVGIGLMDPQVAQAGYSALDKHFEAIAETLKPMMGAVAQGDAMAPVAASDVADTEGLLDGVEELEDGIEDLEGLMDDDDDDDDEESQ